MITKVDINNVLDELYEIKTRAEKEYNSALTSYSKACVGSTSRIYFHNMVLFLGEILGYSEEKILQDIKEHD